MAARTPGAEGRDRFQFWSFPTSGLLKEYVATIEERSEDELQHLLRCFLFNESTFGADNFLLQQIAEHPELLESLSSTEYGKRLVRAMVVRNGEVYPGLRWIMDLLPDWPRRALAVIQAYEYVFGQHLPNGRFEGLSDASTLITARYLHRRSDNAISALQGISPRELEQLTARLYTVMGYDCELTPGGGDGGRDIIATRTEAGRRERRLIECKHYAGSAKLKDLRALLGVVSAEHASSGVLLTTGRVTKGMKKLQKLDSRLDSVDGNRLIELLDEHFGHGWPNNLDYYLQWPTRDRDNPLD